MKKFSSVFLVVMLMLSSCNQVDRDKEDLEINQNADRIIPELYLGFTPNQSYEKVVNQIDSLLSMDSINPIINDVYFHEQKNALDIKGRSGIYNFADFDQLDGGISFVSRIVLPDEDKFVTVETYCGMTFLKDRLYSICVNPIGGDSAMIANLYCEKYGNPSRTKNSSPVNWIKDIHIYPYGDPTINFEIKSYETLTEWSFKNIRIVLIVNHRTERMLYFEREQFEYPYKKLLRKYGYHENPDYDLSDLKMILRYATPYKKYDNEFASEEIYYICLDVQSEIDSIKNAYKQKIEYRNAQLQLERNREDSIKNVESENRYNQQTI